MTSQSARARQHLDERMARFAPLRSERRPHRGWIRAVRDALGMSGPELARRMGLAKSTIGDIEASEASDTIRLATLRRAADALGCDLVYVFVPRKTLEETVWSRAREKAARHLANVAHHGRLENQEVPAGIADQQVTDLARQLVDRRGLWSDN